MSLYKQPGSDVWYVNITHPGLPRIRQSSGHTDRRQAQKVHDELKAAVWAAKPAGGDVRWSDAVNLWLDAEDRSESELLSLRKFEGHFPDRALSKITPEVVTEALAFCKTAGTFMRYRTMIAAILNLSGVKVKLDVRRDKKKKPRKWITREQWAKLYAELPAHMKPMAEFAIETGLRQANVLGLTWSRVDLDRAFVWIEAEDMKADEAMPVPLSKGALRVLKNQRALDAHDVFVFTYRGKPIAEIKTAFQAACVRAGVGRITMPDTARRDCVPRVDSTIRGGNYEGFTWHGLRHSWATWHVQAGTPLDVLQKLGGWSDLRMVMNYAHHSAEHLAAFADNAAAAKPKAKR
jgi:integrase